ncbi:STE3-domain-containing protein [Obba rivulosa]|uniref:STE3-domain-containing protein n=1 Tax=Obba rivulosa TaxID=1052685 RepID=A0A8E2AUB6_9APHY|nr:STE3-domain-containing protein [Obba rivulosa]
MALSMPIGAFIAAVLVLIPLPSHWRARNVATLAIIVWLFVLNVIYCVNTIVWRKTVLNYAPVWCDITTKIIIGSSTALPACTLCICKHLELVASTRVVRLTYSDKRRRMIFEVIMCYVVPVVMMALHYIVQGHRFDIVEEIGCLPATYFSVPAVLIVWFLPFVFAVITMIYAAVAFYHFFQKRVSFATHLVNSNTSLSTNRYLRLMAMAVAEMIWGTALTTFTLIMNVVPGLLVWDNWADVHSDFDRVDMFPTVLISPSYLAQLMLVWWAIPISAYLFFLFFGFGGESVQDYRRAIDAVRCKIFRMSPRETKSAIDSLPTVRPPRHVMKTISTVDLSDDKEDFQTLPSYSPPANGGVFVTSPIKAETLSDSTSTFLDIESSPLEISFPSSSPTSSTDTALRTPPLQDDVYPVSLAQEAAPANTVFPYPAYHRPFSPSNACPVPSTQAQSQQDDVTQVDAKCEVPDMV